ncbi:MAG: phage integrase SAM-like domain-containing protein [Crocinitomicaceae bacterium]|nr:phage integrase SAM-like domain-containing protein [Crocinitomicaceae bacterium]
MTPDWIRGFIKFLLTKMGNNTARHYVKSMKTALRDAERADIIRKSPFSLMDSKDLGEVARQFQKGLHLKNCKS